MGIVTVGAIGAGRIGKMHVHNLVHHVPGARVKAVASPHVDAKWAEQLGIPTATTHADVLLNDPEIEAIVIATSSARHAEFIRRAAHAGKQIFCEKPIAFEEGPFQDVIAAVEAAGVQLQVGFNRRFDSSICKMATAVHAGEVGELHGLRIINRDPTSPPIEFVRTSGGMFFDFTIHDLDTIGFLSGSEIEEIYTAGAVLIDPEIGAAGDIDTAIITLRLANGALCVIDNSRQARYGYDQRFEAFGTKGNLVVDNTRPTTMQSYLEHGVFIDMPHPWFIERYREAFINEMKEFVRCVGEGSPVSVTAEDALAAVRAAGAARTSMLENRPVRLADSTEMPAEIGP